MARHRISVRGLPAWVPTERLLDAGVWTSREDGGESVLSAERGASDAADIQARLRGMVLAGVPLSIEVEPGLPRSRVREARLTDARRRRETTPGFDRPGCRMDEEGRWSLTPAVIAREIGARAGGRPVLDLGCGVGGNSIGFARAGCDVLAVERDADRIEHARHNAKVYQVADRIQFTLGDAYAWSARAEGRIVFVDPPWGKGARASSVRLEELPLLHHLHGESGPAGELWAKVPTSFDLATASPCDVAPIFGEAAGDRQFLKFLLLRWNAE